MRNLTINETIEKMRNSYGFVVLLNTGKTISVVVDDPSSMNILAAFLKKYPQIQEHLDINADDFDPSLN